MKKKVVVLSGAGISAESGLKTFRDSDGLWENHRVEDVATPEAWLRDKELVLRFYNERRAAAALALPNAGHVALAELEQWVDVQIITQNVDDLHERAGSSKVLHLHGELTKARSVRNPDLIYDIGSKEINLGDKAEDGHQLRPHIVWFGEMVPMIQLAAEICQKADIFIVVGTSMQVYPAAGLINEVERGVPVFIVDKAIPKITASHKNIQKLEMPASTGLPALVKILQKDYL